MVLRLLLARLHTSARLLPLLQRRLQVNIHLQRLVELLRPALLLPLLLRLLRGAPCQLLLQLRVVLLGQVAAPVQVPRVHTCEAARHM